FQSDWQACASGNRLLLCTSVPFKKQSSSYLRFKTFPRRPREGTDSDAATNILFDDSASGAKRVYRSWKIATASRLSFVYLAKRSLTHIRRQSAPAFFPFEATLLRVRSGLGPGSCSSVMNKAKVAAGGTRKSNGRRRNVTN